MSDLVPLVTVGIPTFNRELLIGRAITSVLNQDYPNIEILVSDNCSTDSTPAICQRYAKDNDRIRYIRQARNIGATGNFIEVSRYAEGQYFMWLGDDDWIDPNYISTMLTTLSKDQSIAMASGIPIYYRNGEKESVGRLLSVISKHQYRRVLYYYWHVTDNGIFYGLMRTSAIRQVRLRNIMGGDWIFVANLAALGKLVVSTQASVHREMGGATISYKNIATALNISRLHAILPFVSIAFSAFLDLVYHSKIYQDQPRWERLSMATATFFCIICRAILMNLRNSFRKLKIASR